MAYSCCFSLGGSLDFLEFLQKKFYNINFWLMNHCCDKFESENARWGSIYLNCAHYSSSWCYPISSNNIFPTYVWFLLQWGKRCLNFMTLHFATNLRAVKLK